MNSIGPNLSSDMRIIIAYILFAIADRLIGAALWVEPMDVPAMPEWMSDV